MRGIVRWATPAWCVTFSTSWCATSTLQIEQAMQKAGRTVLRHQA
jgi:hypothetical protein